MHQFIGKSQTASEVLDPARLMALSATLAVDYDPQILPPFAHHIYFWHAEPPSKLGRDGHPAIGDFIPNLGLPRRMWAGGRLRFHAPIQVGQLAEKRTIIANVVEKTGRSGPLAFVTLRHEYSQNNVLCRTEEQDIVYREEASGKPQTPTHTMAETDEDWSVEHAFNPTLLFRYSALTFNGHRIHYDRDYAKDTEGYAGLVTHGPLLAHLLMDQALKKLGTLNEFEFRAASPLMDHEVATLCGKVDDVAQKLWIRAADGRLVMTAIAS